jgi:hypothetical protein
MPKSKKLCSAMEIKPAMMPAPVPRTTGSFRFRHARMQQIMNQAKPLPQRTSPGKPISAAISTQSL